MNDQKQRPRFIRRNGRIIPIASNRERAMKKTSIGLQAVSGAAAASGLVATAAAFALKKRVNIEGAKSALKFASKAAKLSGVTGAVALGTSLYGDVLTTKRAGLKEGIKQSFKQGAQEWLAYGVGAGAAVGALYLAAKTKTHIKMKTPTGLKDVYPSHLSPKNLLTYLKK